MDTELYTLAKNIGEQLQRLNLKLATAESCTGGWIAQSATAVPGSSTWFETGLVTYSNHAKQHFLEVPGSYFSGPQAPGAVSRETVLAMSRGALAATGADCAMATSGVAGPDGGSDEKPVGTVWIAWAVKTPGSGGLIQEASCFHFTGDRENVRRCSVIEAWRGLDLLLGRYSAQSNNTG